jgi:hypothetical protein
MGMIKKHVVYDSSWLVELAERQLPEKPEIIEALKRCTSAVGFCGCGCGDPYFIDPESEEWDFLYNETLVRGDGIEIILDVMKSGRIGFVEIGEWEKKR